jgi:predicted GIY-YIG superfamily endonuclease
MRRRFMTGQPGVVYMLHFDHAYQHARHYVGWTEDLLDRMDAHATGHGARLVAVIWQAGIGFTLIRICQGTRHTERAIKNAGGAVRYCPACTPRPRNGHWAALEADFVPRIYLNPRSSLERTVAPDATS